MNACIGRQELARMFAGAAARIREEHALLSELDSIAGDGDHGATMLRVVDRMEHAARPDGPADLSAVLREAGWEVLGVDGGASSSLLGTFLLGMADAADCSDLCASLEAGLAALSRQTKAQPGDKTMMDALVPAIRAQRAAADSGKGALEALHDASEAARAGAAATSELTARYGRAKYLGEKTRGHPDPGATSIALLLEGFCRGLAEAKGEAGSA